MYRATVRSVTNSYFSVRKISHTSISAAVRRRQCSACVCIMRRSREKPQRENSSKYSAARI